MGRVPTSDPEAIPAEIDRRARGVVEMASPEQSAREISHQLIRELFDVLALDDLRGFWQRGTGKLHRAKQFQARVGKRFLLLVWLVEPGFLSRDGNDISLTKLAEQLGCTAPALSPLSAELSRRLKLRNYFQDHDSQPGRTKKINHEADEDDAAAQHEPEETNAEN